MRVCIIDYYVNLFIEVKSDHRHQEVAYDSLFPQESKIVRLQVSKVLENIEKDVNSVILLLKVG